MIFNTFRGHFLYCMMIFNHLFERNFLDPLELFWALPLIRNGAHSTTLETPSTCQVYFKTGNLNLNVYRSVNWWQYTSNRCHFLIINNVEVWGDLCLKFCLFSNGSNFACWKSVLIRNESLREIICITLRNNSWCLSKSLTAFQVIWKSNLG